MLPKDGHRHILDHFLKVNVFTLLFSLAMAEKKKEINIVDQNAIWRETIRKENRCQKLYTTYHINPYKNNAQISGERLEFVKPF